MSVTLSVSTRMTPVNLGIKSKLYHLNIRFYGTGDGSGGTVSVSYSFPSLLATDVVTFVDGTIYQDNASTDTALMGVLNEQWNALHNGNSTSTARYLIIVPSGAWVADTTGFHADPLRARAASRVFLGSSLVASPTFAVNFTPNTNAKNYIAQAYFLVERDTPI